MTGLTSTSATNPPAPARRHSEQMLVWQWQIRVFHWPFALSVVTLFFTGLWINDPWFSANGDTDGYLMGTVRFLHFAAAAVFTVAFVWRMYWFWAGNKYARSGLPRFWQAAWWRELFSQMFAYARYDFRKAHVGHNALAGLSYTVFVIGLGWLQLVTGLALYGESNPGGFCDTCFGWALPLFGGSFRTHMWHHLFAWGFAMFVVLHVYIVLLDARMYRNGLIRSMVTGRKTVVRQRDGHLENDDE